MTDILDRTTPRGKVTFHEPHAGWSPEVYERELAAYATGRGRAPQSVTMQPDTAAALGLREGSIESTATRTIPLVVTSRDYQRDTITLYY